LAAQWYQGDEYLCVSPTSAAVRSLLGLPRYTGRPVEVWLRRAYAAAYADDYCASRKLDRSNTFASIHSAVYAWSWGLASLGFSVPPWNEEPVVVFQAPPIVEEFIRYRLAHRGISESRASKETKHLAVFLPTSSHSEPDLARLDLKRVDDFISELAAKYSRRTVADFCTTLRAFLRFLHVTGRLKADYSGSVCAPVVRAGDRPPRALPWDDVLRILEGIDTEKPNGLRDYAMLLMMSV